MKNSRATYAHKSLVLNEHYSAANPPVLDRAKAQDTITIDRLIIRPQFRDTREALHLAQGGTAGRVHKGMLAMQAQGRILVPNASQAASLEDREKALRLAFDPYECYRDSPSTDGVYALSWLEPTLDTTNYATGWMPVTRYVRPVAQPETMWTINDQSYRSWAVGLVAPDPRLYDTTNGTATVTTPFSSTNLINKGSVAGPLRVTITMSGAGNAAFTITRSAVSFVLDLTTMAAAGVVVVVMETCGPWGIGKTVTKNGTAAFSLKTSAATTWLDVPAGTTAFTHTNTGGVTSIVYDWGHARP
jgi:hypothetical protein